MPVRNKILEEKKNSWYVYMCALGQVLLGDSKQEHVFWQVKPAGSLSLLQQPKPY